MRRSATVAAAALTALLGAAATARAASGGVAVEGSDRARVRLPAAARVTSYQGGGYRLRADAAHPGEVEVEVSLAPLDSAAPFAPPPAAAAADPVGERARRITAGAGGEYAAVSRVLGWVVHHVVDAPAAAPGDAAGPATSAAATLERGAGDSREVAALTAALLGAVGIEARVVDGFVAGPPRPGSPHGAHSWVEVRYPDRGWVPSDPLFHHHYVPADHVRLGVAGTAAPAAEDNGWRLVERRDRRTVSDVYPAGAPGVMARKNHPEQLAGALRVVVAGAAGGVAVLAGRGGVERRLLVDGESIFVGLAGGRYTLEVLVDGRAPRSRRLELAPRQRSAVFLEQGHGGDGSPPPPPVPAGRPAVPRRAPRSR